MVDKQKESARLAKRLGQKIALRRKQLSWTQDQLAERVGVDAETISRFERGANLPSLPSLERLAAALNIEPGELLSKASTGRSTDVAKISAWLEGLSARDRNFVMKLVRECSEHLRKKTA
ncbi:MAG: hypothetical protein HDKAJFGB_03939 [Anaerolineae bacterium]|nr:hypothetical protein [Anaerolineae bacterium]